MERELPPRAPHSAEANWPSFCHPISSGGGGGAAESLWVDEFLDFSAAKRAASRRSASDSVAFVETAPADGNDADQMIMSMFSDEVPRSPSETAPGAAGDQSTEQKAAAAAASEQIVDPKRAKRILANRQSAQRSRIRKLQYISELERSVTSLETEVSTLSPRVAFLDQQRSLLTLGNSHLKQRIAALAQDKVFKDAHQEALRKEIDRLRQIYQQQSFKAG
ncbi:basic leucine zipper 6-like isoform X1 [Zingiber officinale]|uniref:basic leucine zipper 6-like isoform X1 n=1 Tax=Zingiber officinale TaxID=94328 RepID=UPI001C4DD261|nr:basic leucine zipper 6-like isoform X1 [Zingiber officinale]